MCVAYCLTQNIQNNIKAGYKISIFFFSSMRVKGLHCMLWNKAGKCIKRFQNAEDSEENQSSAVLSTMQYRQLSLE